MSDGRKSWDVCYNCRTNEDGERKMRLLYSNMLPLKLGDGQTAFIDYFMDAVHEADEIDIAVGYVSKAALKKLQGLVDGSGIKKVCLTIGMYYHEGMPEGTYNVAAALNEDWTGRGIGEVRLVRAFKYHGKAYVFYKNGKPFSAVVGSHNLGAIELEASNLRQYELSVVTEEPEELQEISAHVRDIMLPKCSANITDLRDVPLIREINRALVDQEFVSRVTPEEVDAYKKRLTEVSFEIPLKVPEDENDQSMRGSNINVCYASGRKRMWWEIEIVVSKTIRKLPGYPPHQKPFIAITDDGWKFQVWTCGQNNKNLYSKDDLKIMGRWIKGRLVAAGLVEPVNRVESDQDGKGVITHKMLNKYGRDTITLTKTDIVTKTEDGAAMEVWMLSFLPESRHQQEDADEIP